MSSMAVVAIKYAYTTVRVLLDGLTIRRSYRGRTVKVSLYTLFFNSHRAMHCRVLNRLRPKSATPERPCHRTIAVTIAVSQFGRALRTLQLHVGSENCGRGPSQSCEDSAYKVALPVETFVRTDHSCERITRADVVFFSPS